MDSSVIVSGHCRGQGDRRAITVIGVFSLPAKMALQYATAPPGLHADSGRQFSERDTHRHLMPLLRAGHWTGGPVALRPFNIF